VIGVMCDRLGNLSTFVWEFKYIKTKKINYKTVYAHLEPHQITNLFKLSNMGADAQVIAYHMETQQYYFYPFRLLNGQETKT
jgi:hypothetical protein